jgi:hypothetical protein
MLWINIMANKLEVGFLEEEKYVKTVKKHYVSVLVLLLALVVALTTDARADLFSYNGTSNLGHPVNFSASLTINTLTDTLTIILTNNGPTPTAPNDVLNSFYFDISNISGVSPTLTGLIFAQGELYNAVLGGLDTPVDGVGPDNLLTQPWWIARTMGDPLQAPYLVFGIGSAGNNLLTPNNFPAMDGVNGGISFGDIETHNLTGSNQTPLVKGSATFILQFDSLDGFSVGPTAVFGMGTAPDSWVTVPVPGAVLIGLIGLVCAGLKLRKYA